MIIVNVDDEFEFEDLIKITKQDFDTQEEYNEFLKVIYKFEFDRFLIDADIVLDGEAYNEALQMYVDLDNGCIDDAMERIERFNNFIDSNNKF